MPCNPASRKRPHDDEPDTGQKTDGLSLADRQMARNLIATDWQRAGLPNENNTNSDTDEDLPPPDKKPKPMAGENPEKQLPLFESLDQSLARIGWVTQAQGAYGASPVAMPHVTSPNPSGQSGTGGVSGQRTDDGVLDLSFLAGVPIRERSEILPAVGEREVQTIRKIKLAGAHLSKSLGKYLHKFTPQLCDLSMPEGRARLSHEVAYALSPTTKKQLLALNLANLAMDLDNASASKLCCVIHPKHQAATEVEAYRQENGHCAGR